jgi:putative ABC transport system permease protein
MDLPVKYNLRNVVVRWRATLATILGIALVVAVFVLVQSLAIGLEQSSQSTGDPRNLLIVRKGSVSETQSQVTRENLRRMIYRSEIARPVHEAAGQALIRWLESDKQLMARARPETEYYAEQTRTATPIRILGDFLATMMSIGAVFAAMNTMYASIGARIREVGTLRVLGYRRRAIITGFLIEGAFLALIGGALGCLLSLPMNGYATGTIKFETFSEVIFEFHITPWLMAKGLLFAVTVGVLGSLLPAMRPARMPVIAALKSV